MKKIFIIYSLSILTLFSFIYGCSEVKDNVTATPVAQFHQQGWLNPTSAGFHGKAIEAENWNMNSCKSCHGADFSGGTSGSSCMTCHSNGPQACNVCHGNSEHINPPKAINGNTLNTQIGVGAHVQHMLSDTTQRYSAIVKCNECHTPVTSFSDTNHIRQDGITAAKVNFGMLSKTVTDVTPNPVWDKSTQTCSNVYCHGMFKNGNQSAAPSFIDPNSVKCGSCHGNPTTGNPLPGGTHTNIYPSINQCYLCHGGVMNQNGTFKNRNRHVNGIVDIGIK